MSKKKSLGSSPIAFKTDTGSDMGFIPDLGVSKSDAAVSNSKQTAYQQTTATNDKQEASSPSNEKTTKKIASYNLEVDVINKIKAVADESGMYYSTLVNNILKSWFAGQ